MAAVGGLRRSACSMKRPRSEKKAIPEEQKDYKYFERRKRNNEAAKKSRDARKTREDEIAIRASYLEKENLILRTQVQKLRDEAQDLRNYLSANGEGFPAPTGLPSSVSMGPFPVPHTPAHMLSQSLGGSTGYPPMHGTGMGMIPGGVRDMPHALPSMLGPHGGSVPHMFS